MKVTNLTNSPFDLVDATGKTVRLPARGTLENFEPHRMHAAQYRAMGCFVIEADAPRNKRVGRPPKAKD